MKHKRKVSHSQSGFSLVEVLVAVLLLSVVSLALLAVLDSTNKNQRRAMNRDNLLNLSNQIRSTFTDAALCRQAFIFNATNTISFPAAPTINTNYALNRVTAFGRNLLTTNAPIPTTTDISTPPTSSTTGLRLQLGGSSVSSTPGFTNWDATLVVPLVVVNQAAMKDLTVSFLITTEDANPTAISSCNVMATGTSEQSICESILGGVFSLTQVPQCRLQQTLLSDTQYRDQLSGIPAGSFLAVETPAGSRGIAAFGAGARIGLYPSENDFVTTPTNGVGLTIPANNQLQIDASQGILNDGYMHFTRGASGPAFALKLTNSVSSVDVFTLQRDGRLSANTTQTGAWNNFGASAGLSDIARFYDNGGTARMVMDSSGDVILGPGTGGSKLDVRADAAGSVFTWGLAAGVQGILSANAGAATMSSPAGSNLNLAGGANLNLASGGAMNLASSGNLTLASADQTNLVASNDFRIVSQGGTNTLTFTSSDADFNRNVNAPTFNNVSDRRLKDDIHELDPELFEKLFQIQGYSFVFKGDKNKKRHFGFIAQELQKTYPNLVQTDQKGNLSVNYIEVIPLLVEALKESQGKNRDLELRINNLESSIRKIETQMQRRTDVR